MRHRIGLQLPAVQAVELMSDGTLRGVANFSKSAPRLHPDGSLRDSVTVYDKDRPGHAMLSVVRAPFDAAGGVAGV